MEPPKMPSFHEAAPQGAHPPNPLPHHHCHDDGPDLHELIRLAGGIVGVAERYNVKFVAASGAERTALCPFHVEKRPSFSINIHKDTWICRSRCGGGGVLEFLRRAASKNTAAEAAELLRELAGEPGGEQRRIQAEIAAAVVKDDSFTPLPIPPGAPEAPWWHYELGKATARWSYINAAGVPEGYMCRFDLPDGKQFRPLRWGRQEGRQGAGWRWKGWQDGRPLYRLPEALERPQAPLLVVEGEKSADAAAALFPDLVAVSPMNGSKSPDRMDWSLAAGRAVYVWPDHDPPGAEFAAKVAELVRAAGAASVAVVTVPDGVGEGWDLADPLPAGWTLDTLRAALDAAAPAAPVTPKPAKPAPIRLPAFPRPAPAELRDATVQAQGEAVAAAINAAVTAATIRADHARARRRAFREVVRAMYKAELEPGRKPGRELRKRAGAAGTAAADAAGAAFLRERGLDRLPDMPGPVAYAGSTGTGKTSVLARVLARVRAGNIVVAFPNRAKAHEFIRDLKAARHEHAEELAAVGAYLDSIMRLQSWFGREAPVDEAEPARLMCEADDDTKALIREGQAVGAAIISTVCRQCPLFDSCAYIRQRNEVADSDHAGRRILVTTHAALLSELPWRPDVIVVDEDFARALVDLGAPLPVETFARTVPDVAAAVARPGEELADLRLRRIDANSLRKAAAELRTKHGTAVAELSKRARQGATRDSIRETFRTLAEARLPDVASVLETLAEEMAHKRPGANGVRVERRTFKTDAGELALDVVANRHLRRLRHARDGGSVIALDATLNPTLARLAYGDTLAIHDFAVEQAGTLVQVSNRANGTGRLWRGDHRPPAELARVEAAWFGIIANVESLAALAHLRGGKLFVACTLKLRRQLELELAARGLSELVLVRHFAALRGLNEAQACPVAYIIGRELLRASSVEDVARALATRSPAPFVSVGDGELPQARRPYTMRDGSTVEGRVRTHPDPIAAVVLEQAQEAELEQAIGRIRATFAPKLIVLDTEVPTRLTVDRLVTGAELDRAAVEAGAVARDVLARGAGLLIHPAVESDFTDDQPLPLRSLLLRDSPSHRVIQATVAGAEAKAHRRPATVYGAPDLSEAEAWTRALAVEPTLRRELPDGFVMEAWRRTGVLCASPAMLRAALPELLADDTAARSAVESPAERATVERLRASYPGQTIRTGRRGKPPMVTYNPADLGTAVAFLSRHLGVNVTLEHYELAPVEPVNMPFRKTARGWDFNLAAPLPDGDIFDWFRWNPAWGPEPASFHDPAALAA